MPSCSTSRARTPPQGGGHPTGSSCSTTGIRSRAGPRSSYNRRSVSGPAPAKRTVLAGYQFMPINAAYRRLRDAAAMTRASGGGPRKVIVCFGGSDPAHVTGRVADELASVTPALEVIVGASYRGSFAGRGGALVRDPLDLPHRLASADLAVVGAGTMKFEVACLGRPAILLAVATTSFSSDRPTRQRAPPSTWVTGARSRRPRSPPRSRASSRTRPALSRSGAPRAT